ncbi:cytochrome-c oxidase, cbb3-type subunit III [uncultured Paracoccus sp.]|uniref:cytochrome-c oxidase, cbb3-type subunit III n=1 Tax=uncultured Paracoccus sp. TaxID=189685 RepID=UPI0026266D1B|nr:cytochrome-c oxidase, cbb3-type subunit III [uncultured Paracoccus sp.]
MDDKETRDPVTGVDTTGHEWDGIKELNNPMPRWWLWTLYGTIVWGIGYAIAYPAWPLVQGATSGLLGYSTRGEVAAEIAAVDARNAEVSATLAAADLATLPVDDPAYQFGVSGGAAVFRANCSQCHGAGAAGGVGYPNLLDDSWLWGGTLDDIEYTVRHGIRNEIDADARFSQMPAFGEMLSKPEIAEIAEHVLALSGQEHDAAKAEAGATLFADNCASCHGEAGTGDREQGAPDLTDAIWLYSGTREAVTETITNARFGVMPAWGPRLSDAEIKAVTLYVHQLGGGE